MVHADMVSETERTEEQALSRFRLSDDDVPIHTPVLNVLFGALDKVVEKAYLRQQTQQTASTSSKRSFARQQAVTTRLQSVAGARQQVDYYYRIARDSSVRTVCEVGFNAGHSAALWLTASPTIHLVTFDTFSQPFSYASLEFLLSRFPRRITAHGGYSLHTVPRVDVENGCDLVHVDGLHMYRSVTGFFEQ